MTFFMALLPVVRRAGPGGPESVVATAQALLVGEEDEDGVVAGQRALLLAKARLVDGPSQRLGAADGPPEDEDEAAAADRHRVSRSRRRSRPSASGSGALARSSGLT